MTQTYFGINKAIFNALIPVKIYEYRGLTRSLVILYNSGTSDLDSSLAPLLPMLLPATKYKSHIYLNASLLNSATAVTLRHSWSVN